nr:hypothetical protein StreXyl84_59070 [Streptomyces sp. Xyl84]
MSPPVSAATSTQLPSALLCLLLIQRASNALARTPFDTGGTAVSSLFPFRREVCTARRRSLAAPHRILPLAAHFHEKFRVQLHADADSVDNSRSVNPSVGAPR